MAHIMQWRRSRRAGVLALAGLWLVSMQGPGALSMIGPGRAVASTFEAAQDPEGPGQDPGGVDPFDRQPPGDDQDMPRPARSRSRSARKKARPPEKGAAAKGRGGAAESRKASGPGKLSFSQDIAPILVANCLGCHSKDQPGARKGKLDLTSFEGLQKGTPDHKVIVPRKPEESHLVQRIKGEEEPKMPQGGNRALSADAIARIARWVKEGARLDAGLDPKVAMSTYAASPEDLRRRQLGRMPVKERDQKVIEAGQARWKQSGSKQKPEVVPGAHFIAFSDLPSDRVSATMRALEVQHRHLRGLLGASAMDWPEKVSLYLFGGNNEFVEFVRSVEGREVDSQGPRYSVRFDVPQPYIAAVDPSGGKKEEPPRRRGRGKKGEEAEDAGGERSLAGLLTEGLGAGSVAAAGKAPRWLCLGIGAFMAASVEPRSPYYQRLRQGALRDVQQGWKTRGQQALGDQLPPEELRADGFALVECLLRHGGFNQRFPAFLQGLLESGGAGLDDVLKGVYNGTREEFLEATEAWIVAAYGQGR